MTEEYTTELPPNGFYWLRGATGQMQPVEVRGGYVLFLGSQVYTNWSVLSKNCALEPLAYNPPASADKQDQRKIQL